MLTQSHESVIRGEFVVNLLKEKRVDVILFNLNSFCVLKTFKNVRYVKLWSSKREIQFIVKFSKMVRGCVISFVLMLLVCLIQCDDHPTQFDYIGQVKYDHHKLPDQNTSGPFLVQVHIYQTPIFW